MGDRGVKEERWPESRRDEETEGGAKWSNKKTKAIENGNAKRTRQLSSENRIIFC